MRGRRAEGVSPRSTRTRDHQVNRQYHPQGQPRSGATSVVNVLGTLAVSAGILVGLIGAAPPSAQADSDTVIGFDQLPDGSPLTPGTSPTTQYRSLGVSTFAASIAGGEPGPPPTVTAVLAGQAPSPTDRQVLDISGCGSEVCAQNMPLVRGKFTDAHKRISVYVGDLSPRMEIATVYFTAYDHAGVQVGEASDTVGSSPPGVHTKLSVQSTSATPDIEYFEIKTLVRKRDVAIDELSFDNPSTPGSRSFNIAWTHEQAPSGRGDPPARRRTRSHLCTGRPLQHVAWAAPFRCRRKRRARHRGNGLSERHGCSGRNTDRHLIEGTSGDAPNIAKERDCDCDRIGASVFGLPRPARADPRRGLGRSARTSASPGWRLRRQFNTI